MTFKSSLEKSQKKKKENHEKRQKSDFQNYCSIITKCPILPPNHMAYVKTGSLKGTKKKSKETIPEKDQASILLEKFSKTKGLNML